ncbi:MAG: putative repeat protein (TIGR01451 family), partial [Pirellulaceae bacterium]
GINNNQNYDTPTAQIQGFGQPNTGRPVASPNFASNGGSNIDDPRNFNAAAATPLGGAAGQGTPGARNLEGPQSPQVVLEKRAPEEIQVNVPATFEIVVRNVGAIDANEVTVVDEVPDGTQFSEASPAAQQIGGSVTWQLGTLKPGDERVLSMVVIPVREGEVGSVARVQFQAQATSRTTCTKPMLKVTQTGPQSVLAGEYVTFTITVSNPGTGAAYDVVLEEDVPAGLSHQAGSELQHSLGTLPPGSTRELQLTLKAEKAGMIANEIRVRGKGKIIARDALKLEVVAPELQLTLDGPSRRYLNREATYTFSVYNPGTAPAKDVELISYLPKGFEFKEADKQGHYDPRKHAVYWSLTQLPPDQKGLVSLTVVPVETGSHKVRAESRAQQNLSAAYEHEVEVSALAELKLTIADSADPIELGKDTVYEIRVTNTGSKEAVNVRLAVTLPVGLRPIGADGPTREQIDGQNVSFQGLTRLDTNSSTVFRVQAQGVSAGDQTIKVQVVCDDSQAPTVYEEVTRVYQD